ncbi:cytochrome C-552 [Sinorhizobium alkalisoli]|uniref:cytochrome C-552 n=1 Tax=Sinorhizobium alkalisoli TaxID=1752398 RepID=UPI000D0899DB|nr:cytochrome C-552 [Sinorhizobium alkalisoli]MCA1492848.1 hypothetical protein [Ensifer sp. NBAIM29]MCG5477938.1 hypothetical protein [Sinorhizobium alkalisoli]
MTTRGKLARRAFPSRRFNASGAISLVSVAACLLVGGIGAPAAHATEPSIQLAQQGGAPGYDPMRRGIGRPTQRGEPAPPGNPELGDLPDAPGAEDTYYLCSACHSIALVTQQRLTDERWNYLWDWMVREQGMPDQDEETREAILNYLQTHFSSER